MSIEMSERESPEIPQHLQEGIRSAEAYEQDERREFQVREYARKLQIPETSLDTNAAVQRYVEVLRDADAARTRLGRHEGKDVLVVADAAVRQRVSQASLLYAAEKMVLEEGFQAHLAEGVDLPVRPIDLDPIRSGSLTRLLGRAGRPFGVSVSVPETWYDEGQEALLRGDASSYRPQPPTVEGLWTGAPFTTGQDEPWRRPDGRDHQWYWPDWPNERHDPEHLKAMADEATRLGIDQGRPKSDPVIHTVLTGIVYGRQLVAATTNIRDLPPAPGMIPSAQERLRRVTALNRLAVGVLEDAVRPGSMTRERFAKDLAPVVSTYKLRIST
jgi:hypothetical protein